MRIAAAASGGDLARAYAACFQLARAHYENFPVASVLLPKGMRPAIAAIYAFARRADDFADEPGLEEADRLRRLDEWQVRLRACLDGPVLPPAATADDLIFFALADAIRVHRLPLAPFEALLSAFHQDVTVKRYRTWNDLLDYCSRSANPVGRLVLRVAGYDHAALDRAADALCTALQLTNFWQDLARDWTIGRLYVPLEERDRAGAREADLDAGRITSEWRSALRAVVDRTRGFFAEGRPVCDGVHGRLRVELRLTWLGGLHILDRVAATDFDVFRCRPTIRARDALPLLWRAASWKAP